MKKIALEEAIAPLDMAKYLHKNLVNSEMKQLKVDLADFTEQRLQVMDRCDVSQMVLSLTSPGMEGVADLKKAPELATRWNDFLCEGIHRNRDRLKGFACLPMADPEAAAQELRRAVLDLGFVGALINGYTRDASGKPLYYDAPEYYVFWQTAVELNVPIYIHPRVPANDHPDSIYHHYPEIQGSEWGFHTETGEHILRLILSGLFDVFPSLQLIIGHMGEILVFWARRIDHRLEAEGWGLREETASRRRAYSVTHYLQNNLHVTTSGYFCDAALRHVIDIVGIDRVCFSIDYPYENCRLACDWFDKLDLAKADKEKIAHINAARLLRL